MVNIELPQQAGGLEAVIHAQLAARAVAIGVDRGFRHAEFARDLLRAEVLVDQPQAVTFALGKQFDSVHPGPQHGAAYRAA